MRNINFKEQREHLIERELRLVGIQDEAVLYAMRTVPREEFVAEKTREFAYRNVALPIELGQTISQPQIVALMAEALELAPEDRVLEIGTGSGYAAAVLSRIAKEVYGVERHGELAEVARERLERLNYDNVQIQHADGTLGWAEHAPYDAISVAAGSPSVPEELLEQLRIGGRLVIPIGESRESQQLVRVRRRDENDFEYEELGGVRFVPLIGEAGWNDGEKLTHPKVPLSKRRQVSIPEMIREAAEPISQIQTCDFAPLLNRIGDARLVLIGEATHGTSEFYQMRAEITKALIRQNRCDFVAIEADWPDAYRIHDYVTHRQRQEPYDWEAFARFPTWMWRNQEALDFIHWLREYNLNERSPDNRVGFFGLDLYSMFTSIARVIEYLEDQDPAAAEIARTRYGCLTPWEGDAAQYGRSVISGRYQSCEPQVTQMLQAMLNRRVEAAQRDGELLFDAQLNAQLVADAEVYYRIMYYGSDDSWNHRDTHMFNTLERLLDDNGSDSRAVLWEHNSHLGNAAATQFGKHGQLNVGELCRKSYGDDVYAIGQGTDHGTVAAASNWEGPMEIKEVRKSHPDSYEHLMHLSEMEAFMLPLTKSSNPQLTTALANRRLERAIGVIYRPETERHSHYFDASLPHQFDEWIWFDRTSAVDALSTKQSRKHEPQHPFAIIDR